MKWRYRAGVWEWYQSWIKGGGSSHRSEEVEEERLERLGRLERESRGGEQVGIGRVEGDDILGLTFVRLVF